MRLRRQSLALAIAASSLGLLAAASASTSAAHPRHVEVAPHDRPWKWPLDPLPSIVERFDPPEEQWSAGHRGIDLAGRVGQPVHAVDDGVVTYAGALAGRGVVVVDHGAIRSTYEPVSAAITRGDEVTAGQVIGVLQAVGSHCLPTACLHLGAKRGSTYLDPEPLLGYPPIRLKPLAGLAHGLSPAPWTSSDPWRAAVGRSAPVTSSFGPRIHPLTGRSSLHDGVDYGVDCGTPIAAPADGTVTRAGADPIYGHQIVVQHSDGLETRYGHMDADGMLVGEGDVVQGGQIIGTVGSDGWSTGCHLHYTVASNGQPIDPLTFVPP